MIWLEETQYCLRIVDSDPALKPDYRAVGTVNIYDDVAILYGFFGKILRSEVLQIFEALRNRRVKHLLIQRANNHRMPFAKKIDDESHPFCGWWHIDLGGKCGK